MNRITIVCESLTGNTAMLAEALRAHLQMSDGCVLAPDCAEMDSSDVFFVGSWTDKGDCGANTAAFLEKLEHKKVFLFGTCGFGRSDAYYDTVYRRFDFSRQRAGNGSRSIHNGNNTLRSQTA